MSKKLIATILDPLQDETLFESFLREMSVNESVLITSKTSEGVEVDTLETTYLLCDYKKLNEKTYSGRDLDAIYLSKSAKAHVPPEIKRELLLFDTDILAHKEGI